MCQEARHGVFQSISNSAYLISATWDNLIKKRKKKNGIKTEIGHLKCRWKKQNKKQIWRQLHQFPLCTRLWVTVRFISRVCQSVSRSYSPTEENNSLQISHTSLTITIKESNTVMDTHMHRWSIYWRSLWMHVWVSLWQSVRLWVKGFLASPAVCRAVHDAQRRMIQGGCVCMRDWCWNLSLVCFDTTWMRWNGTYRRPCNTKEKPGVRK